MNSFAVGEIESKCGDGKSNLPSAI